MRYLDAKSRRFGVTRIYQRPKLLPVEPMLANMATQKVQDEPIIVWILDLLKKVVNSDLRLDRQTSCAYFCLLSQQRDQLVGSKAQCCPL